MITLLKKEYFIPVVESRGYKLEEVMPCVIKQDGDNWTIDNFHPSYPRPKNMSHEEFMAFINQKIQEAKNKAPKTQAPQQLDIGEGVGTELKKLLKMVGITATPNCSCNARAKLMNQNGLQWCKDNIDTIVGWLKEEAEKRNLPFFTYGAKKLVKLAIYRAENVKTG